MVRSLHAYFKARNSCWREPRAAGRTGTCCKSPSIEGAGGMELRGILLLRHCMVHTSSGPNLQWTVAKPGAMAKGLIVYPLNRSTSL
ncbi:hypothetical protein SRHO_G00094220 [Serrasalmus rhombeus]